MNTTWSFRRRNGRLVLGYYKKFGPFRYFCSISKHFDQCKDPELDAAVWASLQSESANLLNGVSEARRSEAKERINYTIEMFQVRSANYQRRNKVEDMY